MRARTEEIPPPAQRRTNLSLLGLRLAAAVW